MDGWTGIIGTGFGVLVGAVAEAIRSRTSFGRDKRWSLLQTRREHIERIYLATEELRETSVEEFSRLDSIFRGRGLRPAGKKSSWSNIRMLVGLYAVELKPALGELETAASMFEDALALATRRHDLPIDRALVVDELTQSFAAFTLAYDKFLGNITALSDALVGESVSLIGVSSPARIRQTS